MLVPVTLARTQLARNRFDPDNAEDIGIGICATCSLCGHKASVQFNENDTQAFTGREAVRQLSRTCLRGERHSYYIDKLPAGVFVLWEHRGQLLPAYLIDKALVTCAGPLSHSCRVIIGYEANEHRLAAEDLAQRLKLKGHYTNVEVAKKPGRPAKLKVAGGAE